MVTVKRNITGPLIFKSTLDSGYAANSVSVTLITVPTSVYSTELIKPRRILGD